MEYSEQLKRKASELIELCGGDVDYAWDILSACIRGELDANTAPKVARHWLYQNAALRTDAQAIQGAMKDL